MRSHFLLAAIVCSSCGIDGAEVTSLGITVRYSISLAPDQLLVTGRADSEAVAFEPVLLPEQPSATLEAGKASLVILLPDELANSLLWVRVDGLQGGDVVGSGGDQVTVERNTLSGARVFLGAPAVCGDGSPRLLIEGCDDANDIPGDGCDPGCSVEPGYTCTADTEGGPSTCAPETPTPP